MRMRVNYSADYLISRDGEIMMDRMFAANIDLSSSLSSLSSSCHLVHDTYMQIKVCAKAELSKSS